MSKFGNVLQKHFAVKTFQERRTKIIARATTLFGARKNVNVYNQNGHSLYCLFVIVHVSFYSKRKLHWPAMYKRGNINVHSSSSRVAWNASRLYLAFTEYHLRVGTKAMSRVFNLRLKTITPLEGWDSNVMRCDEKQEKLLKIKLISCGVMI